MSAQPSERDGHDVFRLGGEAAVVPMHEYRMLKALKDRAASDELDEAERDRREVHCRPGRHARHQRGWIIAVKKPTKPK